MAGPGTAGLRLRERVRMTRMGQALLAMSALVALAALNTGANLLFVVLALLVGTIAVGRLATTRRLERLEIAIVLPRLVEAGARTAGRLELSGPRPASLWLGAPRWLPGSGVLVEGEGSEPRTAVFEATAPDRGLEHELAIRIATRAPFGLFERSVERRLPLDVHVHPRFAAVALPPLETTPQSGLEHRSAGQGGSLRELRPYLPGDNPRHIHWRVSARMGELQVRTFHAERQPELVLLADIRGLAGAELEQVLERLAGALRDGLGSGHRVDLRLPGERLRMASPAELGRGLRMLARVAPVAATAGLDTGGLRPGTGVRVADLSPGRPLAPGASR